MFENDELLVVNKPAGMVVHPAAGHMGGTLVNAVLGHDPDLEGYDGTDWPATVGQRSITWATDSYAQKPQANAILFATLYNFWFDADAAPQLSRVIMEPFLPGPEGTGLTALISGPAGGWLPGDFDGDGDVDLSDFTIFQLCFGGSNNPPGQFCPPGVDADLDGDGDVDLADFIIFQQNFTGSS